jgi:hypothetical protein
MRCRGFHLLYTRVVLVKGTKPPGDELNTPAPPGPLRKQPPDKQTDLDLFLGRAARSIHESRDRGIAAAGRESGLAMFLKCSLSGPSCSAALGQDSAVPELEFVLS